MPLQTRQDLVDYCLRTLGAPVINIEIDDEQLSDAIEYAISFYNDYHPDGIERDYLKHKITMTTIEVDDASLINVNDVITSGDRYSTVVSKSGDVLTVKEIKGPTKFAVGDVLTFTGGTATITTITLGDWDNRWIPISEDVQGVIRVLPWSTSVADYMFDITYQLRMNDLRDLSSATMSYFVTSMEHLSLIDFFLRKEKQFRFNRRMNRLYLDINWGADIVPGSYMVIECYRLISDELYPELFNDPWLKKYAAAWVKRYWGANLRKYQGITLPGGVQLDGERIYAEANTEIKELEIDLIQNQAPLHFVMG